MTHNIFQLDFITCGESAYPPNTFSIAAAMEQVRPSEHGKFHTADCATFQPALAILQNGEHLIPNGF